MKNEKLRADIKRELNRPTSMKKLAELLNRCYVALETPQHARDSAELRRLCAERDKLKQQLRAEGDRIAELNAKLGEQQSVPDAVRDALARRCLWLAFVWNDHNFQSAHIEARKEAEKHGITSFDDANEWLSAPSPVQSAWKLVPVELLEELRDAANEAHNEATRPYRMKFFAALVEKADAILGAPSAPEGAEAFNTPAEFLAYKLMVKRSEILGRPLTWRESIELIAITTNMPDADKARLLALDGVAPSAPAAQGGE